MTPEQLKASIISCCLQGKTIKNKSDSYTYKEIDDAFICKQIDDEPYNLPENWVWVKLGDVIDFIGGSQPPKSKFIYEEKEGYIRLIQIRDFKSDAYKVYIPTDSTKKFFCEEDIMIGRYGPPIFQILRGLKGAYNVALMKAEPKIPIERDYLYYLLQDPVLFNALVQKSNRCCGQDGIDMPTLKEYVVGLPPFEEQKIIVKDIERLLPFVQRYTDAYEKLNVFNAKFPDDMRKSILQYAIQGKLVEQRAEEGTAEELYKQIQDEKEKLIKEGKIKKEKPLAEIADDEIPFDIPDSWKWTYIGDLFYHNTGKALNATNREGQELEYITTSNLYWDRFELGELRKMFFKENEIEKCSVKKGDLLVCEGGEIGRAAIWNYDYSVCIQNHIHKLRAYKKLNTKFYYYMFYFYKLTGRIAGKGIGIQGLSSGALHKLVVPLPPIEEQNRIAEQIEKLLPYCERLIK